MDHERAALDAFGDEAVTKVLYLALGRFEKKWTRCLSNWSAVLGQFAVFFPWQNPHDLITLHPQALQAFPQFI